MYNPEHEYKPEDIVTSTSTSVIALPPQASLSQRDSSMSPIDKQRVVLLLVLVLVLMLVSVSVLLLFH